MQACGKKGRRALCQPLAESSMARAPRRDGCGPTGDGKRLVCYSALTLGGLPRGHRSTEVDESRRTGGRTRKRFSADSGWGLSGPLARFASFPRRPPARPRRRGSPAAGQEVPSGCLAGPQHESCSYFQIDLESWTAVDLINGLPFFCRNNPLQHGRPLQGPESTKLLYSYSST